MKKSIVRKLAVLAALVLALMSVSACALGEGVEVVSNPDSQTGYTAVFTYVDDSAQSVQLRGSFNFYIVNDVYVLSSEVVSKEAGTIPEDHIYTPETWQPGMAHINDSGYTVDMTKDENGVWTVSLDLPCASYLYQYIVTDAQGNETVITDPANIPAVNLLGASQERSQFFVPYDAEKQAEGDDWTFLMPIEDESARGELVWLEIEGMTFEGRDTNLQQMMLYLPAGYDSEREEPYKVLFISHGSGGEEGDWFHQGNINNIADRLIASGACEPFIIVCVDKSQGENEEVVENIMEYTIPYLEENYNISSEVSDRAFAGLSAGGKLTYTAYQYESDQFGYFGVFSSAYPAATYDINEAVALGEPVLYLGCGYADNRVSIPSQEGQIPMAPFSLYLDKIGVEHEGVVLVEGAHDWFAWPQLFADFVTTTLWK